MQRGSSLPWPAAAAWQRDAWSCWAHPLLVAPRRERMDFPRPHCCQLTRHCWIQFHAYWMHRGNTELLPCTEPLCRLNVSHPLQVTITRVWGCALQQRGALRLCEDALPRGTAERSPARPQLSQSSVVPPRLAVKLLV